MTDKPVVRPSGDTLTVPQAALVALDKRADEAVDAAVPANTRRAYELELACFVSWCTRHGVRPMPAEPRVIRAYLFELAEKGRDASDLPRGRPKGPFGYSGLERALAAICRSHQQSGHPSPWKDPLIEEARITLARLKGKAPKNQKRALEATGEALLFKVCDLISDDVRGVRDRAMILTAWQGGGRRRSEVAAARVEDFEDIEGGIRWVIPRSKTDQMGAGLTVTLTPATDERYCAVHALRRWLVVSKIEKGPVFRGVDNTGAISDRGLAPEGVSRRVQVYIEKLGLDSSEFGGHSIRSGFVTTAHKLGRKLADIMGSTGHRTTTQVLGYIRRAGNIEESAATGLVDEALKRREQKRDGA